jgi:hypothetical protein
MRRCVHVGFLDLDIVQMNDGIQGNDPALGGFAHHLAMHLAARGYVDNQVAFDTGMAGQPVSGRQRFAAREILLRFGERARVGGARVDAVLGKVALHDENLAATAQSPPTTHRVNINAERTRRLEKRRSDRKSPALA